MDLTEILSVFLFLFRMKGAFTLCASQSTTNPDCAKIAPDRITERKTTLTIILAVQPLKELLDIQNKKAISVLNPSNETT